MFGGVREYKCAREFGLHMEELICQIQILPAFKNLQVMENHHVLKATHNESDGHIYTSAVIMAGYSQQGVLESPFKQHSKHSLAAICIV